MKKHIGNFILRCLMCQQLKRLSTRPARLLQPLDIVEWKCEHVTMNFVTHFPRTSRGHDAVDECKTHLCFQFISHDIFSILYPYSCKTYKISSKLSFAGFLMESK